ncbi:hypothetical protein F2P44_25965 [Massilia sp. CCM 8695]|uniref:peptidylprolyl isomerase n=1 Tax=Massilia frigida TaxID=2609281 RepID=A0ABX0NBL9_9BURK|nr:energy transducer TonB [Massilia frigida]NHZ82698.1 hypothetical protein [Massilia frigida]
MLRLGALVALTVLASAASSAELPLSACAAQTYPAEALRYRMEGATRVQLGAGKAARVIGVIGESGYAVLDRASVALAATCKPARASDDGTPWVITVPWKLPVQADYLPARLAVEHCTRRNKLIRFPELDGPLPNVTVRVLVWTDGAPVTPKIELSSGEPLVDKQAIDIVENCRFNPATLAGTAVEGAILVPLAFDSAGVSDEKLRAAYRRLSDPLLGKKEYKLAQIRFASETAATQAIGEIKGGASFAEIARTRAKKPNKTKLEGELGWMRLAQMDKSIAEVIEAHGVPGVVPVPVRGVAGGWHVIEIQQTRPAESAGYEQLKAELRRKLIEERDIVVQQPPALN